jgi:alpha-glucoside transport system substrate-binding protein
MKFTKTAAAGLAIALIATPSLAATKTTKKVAKKVAKKTTKPKATTKPTDSAPAAVTKAGGIECKAQYKGKSVSIFSPNDDAKDIAAFEKSWAPYEACTGIDVKWEGSKGFEADVKTRVQGGSAPAIIDFPQPGLLGTIAKLGKLSALPADIKADLDKNFLGGWTDYGTVDGKLYGAAFQSNFKSFVWYNPQAFKAKGYAVPKTLDEMKTLSDKIVADGGTPWCAGIESEAATGWVVTDWTEDMMLRTTTPKKYDDWVNHKIPFNAPEVKAALDAAGGYLKNEKYVGNVKAIATTRFQDGGLPIQDGKCYMHRQANFYKSFWAKGTVFGDAGTISAFYLPMKTATEPKAMLGGGDILAATNDKPETIDTIRYLTSVDFANAAAANAGKFSPRKDYDTNQLPDKFDKVFADIGKSADVFRFDGSDLMPGAVGADSFWKQGTAWITGQSTDDTLAAIEKSWPAA